MGSNFYSRIQRFKYDLDYLAINDRTPYLEAPPYIVAQLGIVSNKPHFFITNLKGLISDKNAVQILEEKCKLIIPKVESVSNAYILPFLGETQELLLIYDQEKTIIEIPPIYRGAVVWYE
jgi:hypothetical protein